MKRKLMLIAPHRPGRRGEETISVIVQMPLNLGYLIALTPDHWEIEVIDEMFEPALTEDESEIVFDGDYDLVGVTGYTYHANRAYRIAQACRKAGIKTVFGGIHASVMPEEAGEYFDSVVTGEAEQLWPVLLQDFEKGEMKPLYEGGNPDLSMLTNVIPDRDFLKNKYGYEFSSIITTRGCPYLCDFCSVPTFQGKFRQRTYMDVIKEMQATDYKGLMLAEDNFFGHGPASNERAKNLFKTMTEMGIWKDWFGFSALNTTQDDDMLKYMASSGSFGMLIGIESNNPEVLKKMNKFINLDHVGVDNYKDAIRKMHDHGLVLWGSVIFGADGETPDTFKAMADFVWDTSMDILTFGISTPLPKTPLFWRICQEGRIFRSDFPWDWQYYDTSNLCYRLDSMTLDQFIDGMHHVYEAI